MSALQVRLLNNHFQQGNISQEEFASLYSLITRSEIEAQKTFGQVKSKGIPRLHPMTRRTLSQVRVFRTFAKVVNYLLVFALICFIYLVVENYRVTGTMPALSLEGLEKVLTQTPRKPLPSDIVLAAELLSSESAWHEDHVSQFSSQWQALQKNQQQRYRNSQWFKAFTLALSLQIVEQRSIAKQGNRDAMQKTVVLERLSEKIKKIST